MKRRIIWGLILLAAATGVVWSLRPRAVPVEVGRPTRMTVHEYIAEDAETQLAETYTIDMPVSGTLERITYKIGDVLAEGDVAARVDTLNTEQQIRGVDALIAQARAQIEGVDVAKPKEERLESAQRQVQEAQAAAEMARKGREIAGIQLDTARKDHARTQSLFEKGAVSQRQRDEAESAFRALEEEAARAQLAEQAAQKSLEIVRLGAQELGGSVDDNEFMRRMYEAQIEQLNAQRRILEEDLAKCVIKAPVSGPILMKFVEDRRTLMVGTPLLVMGDPATSEILSDVLSEEVGRIQLGDPVEITGKATGAAPLKGTVKRIYPAAFKKISSLGIEQQRVRVLIDSPDAAALRPGTSLDVRIITDEQPDALAVPERAVFQLRGKWHVFRVENGRAALTPVDLGLKNEDWAEIRSGVSERDDIIIEPSNDVKDGTRITAK